MNQQPHTPTGSPKVKRQPCARFQVAMGVAATIEPTGRSGPLPTTFVGLDRDAYIALRLPESPDQDLFTPGTSLAVHFQYNGKVCGFETSVLTSIRHPFPILFVAIPDTMELSDMREEMRVNSFMPATAYCMGCELKAVVLNISLLGCRLLLDPEEAKDLQVKLGLEVFTRVTLMGMAHELYLHGILKNISRCNEKTVLGVAFANLSEEVIRRLTEYVTSLRELQEP